MGDVRLLAGLPGRLGNGLGIGTAIDDGHHGLAKPAADFFAGSRASLVFDRVVRPLQWPRLRDPPCSNAIAATANRCAT